MTRIGSDRRTVNEMFTGNAVAQMTTMLQRVASGAVIAYAPCCPAEFDAVFGLHASVCFGLYSTPHAIL